MITTSKLAKAQQKLGALFASATTALPSKSLSLSPQLRDCRSITSVCAESEYTYLAKGSCSRIAVLGESLSDSSSLICGLRLFNGRVTLVLQLGAREASLLLEHNPSCG